LKEKLSTIKQNRIGTNRIGRYLLDTFNNRKFFFHHGPWLRTEKYRFATSNLEQSCEILITVLNNDWMLCIGKKMYMIIINTKFYKLVYRSALSILYTFQQHQWRHLWDARVRKCIPWIFFTHFLCRSFNIV